MPLLLNGFTDHTIDTGEVEIGYSVGPDNGPPMLMLHGVTSLSCFARSYSKTRGYSRAPVRVERRKTRCTASFALTSALLKPVFL